MAFTLLGTVLALLGPATATGSAVDNRRIGISLSREAFSPNGDGRKDTVLVRFRLPEKARVTVLVRRPNGRVVARSRLGAYTVVFTTRDEAGNVARRRLAVEVSHEALVARQASVLVTAVEAVPPPEPYTGCNGCGEEIAGRCGTVTAPGRFGPGSLRYASRDTCDASLTPFGKAQAAREHATAMVRSAAYGPRTVTSSGGPSVPGGADMAHLLVDGVDTTRVGDGDVTSQRLLPSRPGATERWVPWRFETRGTDSYDVASFRLDYTYYVAP